MNQIQQNWIHKGKRFLHRQWVRRGSDRRIQSLARLVARRAPAPSPGARPVLFFNASTRLSGVSLNAAFSLLAAWSLRLKGVPVIHFVCGAGMTRCVHGIDRDDPSRTPPCQSCTAQSRVLYTGADTRWLAGRSDEALAASLAGQGLEQLSCFEYQGVPLGSLVLPSLRWVLRRHHLADDEATRLLYRHCIQSAWNVARGFEDLLAEVHPRCVVVFNGQFFPEATARWVAHRHGLRVISHEVGLMPDSAYFTPGEATAYPIDIPDDFELSPEQNERLDAYLEKRFQGNFSMAGIRFWPEMRPLSMEFWQCADQFRQIVPVFTNVIFDTSQGHANVLFPHMFAWLDQVHEIAAAHPDTFFVLRAHPDESRPGKESRESVAGWVRQSGADRLPNLMFVDADQPFSSYELIQKSRFVMVYNSTIGLEASLLGAAVLCGGKARFTQLPTVFFPASAAKYRQAAEEFLSAERIAVPGVFRRNARRFLYYQLFRTSLPFGHFVEEDGVWRGYVRLKRFDWWDLLPERSPALGAIVDGILNEGPFLLPE